QREAARPRLPRARGCRPDAARAEAAGPGPPTGSLSVAQRLDPEVRADRQDVPPREAVDDIARWNVLPRREDGAVALRTWRQPPHRDQLEPRPDLAELDRPRGLEVADPGRIAVRVADIARRPDAQHADEHRPWLSGPSPDESQLDDIAESKPAPDEPDQRVEQPDQAVLDSEVDRPCTRGVRRR